MKFQIFFLLVLVATATATLSAKAASCEAVKSQTDCLSDSTCSWCTSGAVGASCMDKVDADSLPSSVFTCTSNGGVEAEAFIYGKPKHLQVGYNACCAGGDCCSAGETCCNSCDGSAGGCTCTVGGKCPAGIGAIPGAEGFNYKIINFEVVLTKPTDELNKYKRNQETSPELGATDCQTANYLRAAGFPSSSIGTMVCIAKWESSFNCQATNHNSNDSTDYGLFQINSYYWCSGDPMSKYNECNASCSSLFDCQSNANCAYKVYKEQGYTAWYGYQSHKAECDAAPAPC